MITGLVSVAVAAAVLGSLRRAPRRRDLTLLSLGPGGRRRRPDRARRDHRAVRPHPAAVMGHFLLSMVLVADAVVLHHRAGEPDDGAAPTGRAGADPAAGLGHWWPLTGLVLLVGTVVTGTGPARRRPRRRAPAVRHPRGGPVHSGAWRGCCTALLLVPHGRATRRGWGGARPPSPPRAPSATSSTSPACPRAWSASTCSGPPWCGSPCSSSTSPSGRSIPRRSAPGADGRAGAAP